jgi:hypothetical protein
VFTSETPFSELDKAAKLLADFNNKKTLKTSANAHNILFASEDKGSNNDAEGVEDWDLEEAENILKEA